MENNLTSPLVADEQSAILPETEYPLHRAQTTNLSDERVAQADKRREQELDERSASEFLGAVWEQDGILPALNDAINPTNFPVDENWDGPTDQMLKESGIPRDFIPELYKTVSQDHYDQTLAKLNKAIENEQTISDYGVAGAFARFGLNVLDPGNLAIAATLPLASMGVPEALMIQKATRVGSAMRYGALGGAESAGVQALINESNPLGTPEDILYAGIIGVGFGGAVGGTFHKNSRALSDEIEQHATNAAREADIKNGVSTTGAMEVTGPEANQSLADKPLTEAEQSTPRTAFERFRFDTAAIASKSGLDTARKLGADMVEDGVGKQGHEVNSPGGSASTIQRQEVKARLTQTRKVIEPAYLQWSQQFSRTKQFINKTALREDFFRQVFRHKETGNSTDPHVIKAAEGLRRVYDDLLDAQKSAGVFGTANIEKDPHYVPHIWIPQKVRQLIDETNESTVTRLFYQSMTNGLELDADEAAHIQRVATAVVKKLDKRASPAEEIDGFSLNMADAEQLKILMREIGEETDEDALETIVQTVTRKQQQAGKAGHLRRRMDLDMSVSISNPRTGKPITLYDLLEDDVEKATLRYIQKSAGLIGFAKKGYGRERSVDADLNAYFRRIDNESRTKGIDPDKTEKTIHALRVASDNILGKPMDDLQRTAFGRALRAATDAAFIRFMGQTGAASVAETGQAIAYAGVNNAMKQLGPSFVRIFQSMQTRSAASNDLATELEAMGMFGGHRLNNETSARYNDHDIDFLKKSWRNFDNVLQRGKQLTVRYSGISMVTDFTQELAGRAAAQRFYNDSMRASSDFDAVWDKRWKRLHLYGMDKDMARRVYRQIQKYAEGEPSKLSKSKKLGRLNLSQWDDKKALDHFSNTMFRMVTHAVQEHDPGNLLPWMHKDLAKAFMQFRSFITGAYTRATLNGLHMRDTEAALGFTLSMVFGWASYVFQQQVNSIGRDDRDNILEERLSPERQLAALYSRSAFASFTPAIMDGILQLSGEDPLFNYTRSSGQSQLTMPAWEMFQSAQALGNIAASAVTPREVTEGDMDSAMGLISNMWILRNFTAAIDDGVDLPYQQDN